MFLLGCGTIITSTLLVLIGKLIQHKYVFPLFRSKRDMCFIFYFVSTLLPWVIFWDGWDLYYSIRYEIILKLMLSLVLTYGVVIGTCILVSYIHFKIILHKSIHHHLKTMANRYFYLSLCICWSIYLGVIPNLLIFSLTVLSILPYFLKYLPTVRTMSSRYVDTLYCVFYQTCYTTLVLTLLILENTL
jgi:hypothetical protein